MATERIMVVEDERLFALDVRNELTALGYQDVDTAHSAEVALELYEASRPVLVFQDIKIEGSMDGIELGQVFRARGETPIVFMTAFADSKTIARAKQTLPYGYIVKPIQSRELHSVVETALHRVRNDRERAEAADRARALERQLLQTQKMDALKKLSAGMAHELNNALVGVVGNIDLALRDNRISEEMGEHLLSARKGCERSAELTKTLLSFAKDGSYSSEGLRVTEILSDILGCSVRSDVHPQSVREPEVKNDGGRGNILLVDDEEIVVKLLSAQLNRLNFATICFTDPQAAVAWYGDHAEEVDVVVLDMKMPGLNGAECFYQMQRVNLQLKAVVFSGYAEKATVEELLRNGARGFFQKPFDLPSLIETVRELAYITHQRRLSKQ